MLDEYLMRREQKNMNKESIHMVILSLIGLSYW